MTRPPLAVIPRGWTEDEAYEQLEKDPANLEGPNCPWHGPALVVITKSYGVQRPQDNAHMVISIGWRCRHRHCGNKWGWRHWWDKYKMDAQQPKPDRRSLTHSQTDCWCGMPHRREDFL